MSRPASLWRDGTFLRFWAAQTLSLFGNSVTNVALPLVAIITLAASPAQMGYLRATLSLPFLVLGMFIGAWVDRLDRRRVLVSTAACRAALLLLVPLAGFAGLLRIELLYVVAFLIGTFYLLSEITVGAVVPNVVAQDQLLAANSRIESSRAVAWVSGAGVTGLLVQTLTAPVTLIADSVLSALAAVGFATVSPRVTASRPARQDLLREMRDGILLVWRDPALRPLAICMGTFNLFDNVAQAVYLVYMVRDLHVSPALVGIVLSVGSAGGVLGSAAAGQIGRRLGIRGALLATPVVAGLGRIAFVLAGGGSLPVAVAILLAGQFAYAFSLPVFNVNQMSHRQTVVSDAMMGRVNATMLLAAWGSNPFGALLGGLLGQVAGLPVALLVGGLGIAGSALWIAGSPVGATRRPAGEEGAV